MATSDWSGLMDRLGADFAARARAHDEDDSFVAENYAKLKEEVKRTQRSHSTPPPKVPVTPNAPQQPFDLLFMVTAVDDALQLGKAARKALEEAPVV